MKILFKTYILSKSVTITKAILSKYVNLFWNDIFKPMHSKNNNIHLMLLCKVEFSESPLGYRTLANLRKVNFKDKKLFIEYLISRLAYLTDSYKDSGFSKITFSYIVKEGLAEDTEILLQTPVYSVTTHTYNNMQLPLTMEPTEYGKVLGKEILSENQTRYFTLNNGHVCFIDVSKDLITNSVHIQAPVDLKWVDTKINETTFKRAIGKNILFIENGNIIIKSKELNAKPFSTVKVDPKIDPVNTFMTIDIETVNIGGHITPYLICGFSNGKYINSYANDISIEAQNAMFKNFIKQILGFSKLKIIYAHNMSGFDGILLLKHLIRYEGLNIDPLIFNGKLISIKITIGTGKKSRTIIIKDSYLLLPNSLRKLCAAFSVPTQKSFFPFTLTDINYKGVFPSFEAFDPNKTGLTYPEYLALKNKHEGIWSFKDEAIKYCYLDCKSLHDVLVKFNELVFTEFNLNITKVLTLPSLAFRIYKSQFMAKGKLFQLLGEVDRDIRESFTGGAVDVYKTSNNIFDKVFEIYQRVKLYYYDVNSLYPFVMNSFKMPTGKPVAFEGNIRLVEPEAYGFFYCKITSPEYLQEPILQRRIQTKDGVRTIAGLGTWEGWIYSEEMDNAIKYGYCFEIIKGYKFKPDYIFKEYVQKMYTLRMKFPKTHPMNFIAKLLMNSLYGKFGMKTEHSIVKILNVHEESGKQSIEELINLYGKHVNDVIDLDDYLIIIRNNLNSYSYNESNDFYYGLDVNVGIASAITAGGRIWMSNFKNKHVPDLNIYYSDTDSAVIDQPLPNKLVGSFLGQFKLEHVINKAVFLAPKVYALITEDDQEIIKVKGLTKDAVSSVTFKEMELLLLKDSKLSLNQEKWFKKLFESDISVTEIAYQLTATSNKRKPVYDDKNIMTHTNPYNYDDFKDVSDNSD